MNAAIEIQTNLDASAWNRFVENHDQGSFYQLFGWREVIGSALGHRAHYLAASRSNEIVGAIPLIEVKSPLFGHSLISNAFCVGGGPLAVNEQARATLIAATERLARELGVDYVEIRDSAAPGESWIGREGAYAGFERDIAADEGECLKQIPRKQRAVVRKALDSALTCTVDRDVDTFFKLHALTLRNHGTPVYPKRYFEKILSVFGDQCDILTIWNGETPVSSVLSYYFRNRVTPYFTGSIASARDQGANDLMYWRLMRHATARGCTKFDFGRSKVGTGPYAFKKNWGFDPRPITHWFYLLRRQAPPNVSPANPKFSLAIQAWRRLPLPIANLLSGIVSPHLA